MKSILWPVDQRCNCIKLCHIYTATCKFITHDIGPRTVCKTYAPVKSKLQQRPHHPGTPRAFDAFSCPGKEGIWSPLIGGGEFDR